MRTPPLAAAAALALLALASFAGPAAAQSAHPDADAARRAALTATDAYRIAANDAAYGPGGVDAYRRAALEAAQRALHTGARGDARAEARGDARSVTQSPPDLVGLASATESLSTLVAAVRAAGLVETLRGDGPFTVFAPTNDAFAALGAATLRSLLRPENRDRLRAILTYHVVPGRYSAAAIGRLDELETANGESLSLGIRVNDARLVATDVEASNGIVHVIDRVLLPRDLPATAAPRRATHH